MGSHASTPPAGTPFAAILAVTLAAGQLALACPAHTASAPEGPDAPASPGTPDAQDACHAQWSPTFGGEPGVSQPVQALAVFDDGSGAGPALYAGGLFVSAGGIAANRIARWNGATWSPLGSGLNSVVTAMTGFDADGDGTQELYVAGGFTGAFGPPMKYVGMWNGSSWSSLGSGLNDGAQALAVFDDGSGHGPALYVAGSFTSAGGVPANRIARWDGVAWSGLGDGVDAPVLTLAVFDDGTGGGPALYAAGHFQSAGGAAADHIARWNGKSWAPVGSGLNGPPSALVAFDDGSGPALYAGGSFTAAGGGPANRMARWDGSTWSPVGGGMNDTVYALTVQNRGSNGGSALYAGGSFTSADGVPASRLAKWDGASWAAAGGDLDGAVLALTTFDDGSGRGPALFAGGEFTNASGIAVNGVASLDASSWMPLGKGVADAVTSLAVFDAGTGEGPSIVAGGAFQSAGDTPLGRIAKWTGASWSPLGAGVNGDVLAMTIFDDGNGGGPALYAGGTFTTAGGIPAKGIARWDGQAWSPLGAGVEGSVMALAVFDDGLGGGPALHAGGFFSAAGGVSASNIARWSGTAWSSLGTGVNGGVLALAVFDSGTGPSLYAGGTFTSAGTAAASRIAKWNGTAWKQLGSGVSGPVFALAALDGAAAGGPALFAGGAFLTAGGLSANRIARWNGSAWAPLGSGVTADVLALAAFDDGTGGGPQLYAGGQFMMAGGVQSAMVAKWTGSAWNGLASGMEKSVSVLAAANEGTALGPALLVGGSFHVSAAKDSFLAKLQGCPAVSPCPADLDGDGAVGGADLGALLGAWGPGGGLGPADLDGSGAVDGADLGLFFADWGECP